MEVSLYDEGPALHHGLQLPEVCEVSVYPVGGVAPALGLLAALARQRAGQPAVGTRQIMMSAVLLLGVV